MFHDLTVDEERANDLRRHVTRQSREEATRLLAGVLLDVSRRLAKAAEQLGAKADEQVDPVSVEVAARLARNFMDDQIGEIPVDIRKVVAGVDLRDEVLDHDQIAEEVADHLFTELDSLKV